MPDKQPSDYSTRGSPGDGMTQALLSRDPLATEAEATPGDDETNPYRELEKQRERERIQERERRRKKREQEEKKLNPMFGGGLPVFDESDESTELTVPALPGFQDPPGDVSLPKW